MPSEYIDVLDPVADHDLNRGLVAWWLGLDNLSGGSTLYDIKRCPGYDGTLTNGPTWSTDPSGFGAVVFDGTNDYVDIGSLLYSSQYSMAALVFPTSAGTTHDTRTVFSIGTAPVYGPYVSVGGGKVCVYSGSTANVWLDGTAGSVPANSWTMIGATGSSAGHAVYANGVQVGSNATASTVTPSAGRRIGGRVDALASSWFPGQIGAVWWWLGRTLTESDYQQHYAQWLARYPDTLRRVSSRAWILGVAQDTPTTAVPGTASGQGTCTAPTITQLYTATPGTAAGTSSVVAPTVILVYTVTPGTATGQGACDDATVTHGTLTVTPGTASGTGSCADVTVTQLFTATPGTADGTGTCTDVTTTFGPLTVTPGTANGQGTCTDISVTLGTLTVTPGTANGQGTCIDVVLSTFEPGIASATSDCVAPNVIQVYTATPGTASGTGTCTSPTVTFGPVSITPGTALGTGTCTDITPTFGPLSVSPGIASGTGTCVDVTVSSVTMVTPGTASATGTCTDATVSEVYYAIPGTATGQGACVDVSVTHGTLIVTPGVANAQGQCTRVRTSANPGSGGGSKLLLMGAT